jgi:hypothetical protein
MNKRSVELDQAQLENKRIAFLKQGDVGGEHSASTTQANNWINAAPDFDESLGLDRRQQVYLSPAVDFERAKAMYHPAKGPVRMHTCWLPSNMRVFQLDSPDTAVSGGLGVGPGDVENEPPASQGASGSCAWAGVDSQRVAPAGGSSIIIESYSGYRSSIATHGCHRGTYKYEIRIDCDVEAREGFGIRIGWATKHHELERILHQPVAAIHGDGYGFNVVNMVGNVFYSLHKGERKELPVSLSKNNRVKKGDVFAVVIHLGEGGGKFEYKPEDIVSYKKTGQIHLKSPGPEWMNGRKPLAGSYMELFWNGVSQGQAFQDEILESTYYPMISLYTNLEEGYLPDGETDASQRARVKVNFCAPWWGEYSDIGRPTGEELVK